MLGGPGSCGGFLILEDGIPTRPAGFCNTNQLIEVNSEQARAIEVQRGPGSALFGSNALHGIVNVLMPEPGDASLAGAALEFGANDYVRAGALLPFGDDASWVAALNYADDGGFRDTIIDGVNGRLLPREDIQSWHAALTEASEEANRRRWAEAGRQRISELDLSPEAHARRIYELLMDS